MPDGIILASGSEIRQKLLSRADVQYNVIVSRVDEESIKSSLMATGARPRDIADTLANAKAQKISQKFPSALVIGCDQVLAIGGTVLSKPADRESATGQLKMLVGRTHDLLSAVAIHQDGQSIWRFVGNAKLTMRKATAEYLDAYVERNWQSIRHSVGCYKLEEEGARLFSRIDGDYFTVLGLPLIELLGYLTERGELPG